MPAHVENYWSGDSRFEPSHVSRIILSPLTWADVRDGIREARTGRRLLKGRKAVFSEVDYSSRIVRDADFPDLLTDLGRKLSK